MEILPLEFIDSYLDLDIIKQERLESEVYTRFPEKKNIPTVLSRLYFSKSPLDRKFANS